MEREITIDASGRVVIPKEVRRRHHLSGGTRLTLVDDDRGLILIPRRRQTTTVERAGLIVFQGRLTADSIDHRGVRDERLTRLACL